MRSQCRTGVRDFVTLLQRGSLHSINGLSPFAIVVRSVERHGAFNVFLQDFGGCAASAAGGAAWRVRLVGCSLWTHDG